VQLFKAESIVNIFTVSPSKHIERNVSLFMYLYIKFLQLYNSLPQDNYVTFCPRFELHVFSGITSAPAQMRFVVI
jgi:hypothetical protein